MKVIQILIFLENHCKFLFCMERESTVVKQECNQKKSQPQSKPKGKLGAWITTSKFVPFQDEKSRLSYSMKSVQFSSVQSLSRVRLFATPWIAACQASLFITKSQSSLRLTYIESMMPSSHLILGHPLLFLPPILPSIRVFSNESTLHMRWPLASFLPRESQGWYPSEWTGWISLQSKGLSRVFTFTNKLNNLIFTSKEVKLDTMYLYKRQRVQNRE